MPRCIEPHGSSSPTVYTDCTIPMHCRDGMHPPHDPPKTVHNQRLKSIHAGAVETAYGVGWTIGPLMAGGLYSAGGYSLPCSVAAIALFTICPPLLLFLPKGESLLCSSICTSHGRGQTFQLAPGCTDSGPVALWPCIGCTMPASSP